MPVTVLKTVVLPAPLGPMTEKTWPFSTEKSTLLTAVRPPKRMVSPFTSSSGMSVPVPLESKHKGTKTQKGRLRVFVSLC
jgi:hypothetical protein